MTHLGNRPQAYRGDFGAMEVSEPESVADCDYLALTATAADGSATGALIGGVRETIGGTA
jgi:hypothetical protein